jgi:hypothetical protein
VSLRRLLIWAAWSFVVYEALFVLVLLLARR